MSVREGADLGALQCCATALGRLLRRTAALRCHPAGRPSPDALPIPHGFRDPHSCSEAPRQPLHCHCLICQMHLSRGHWPPGQMWAAGIGTELGGRLEEAAIEGRCPGQMRWPGGSAAPMLRACHRRTTPALRKRDQLWPVIGLVWSQTSIGAQKHVAGFAALMVR